MSVARPAFGLGVDFGAVVVGRFVAGGFTFGRVAVGPSVSERGAGSFEVLLAGGAEFVSVDCTTAGSVFVFDSTTGCSGDTDAIGDGSIDGAGDGLAVGVVTA
jgi:hypothetical protein